jgi:ring-1,2-phenylacetyl-CoA epoxidase subunit PaaD
MNYTKEDVLQWLEVVKDPEIPVISLVDLGVITGIEIGTSGKVTVNMTPTFAGCPAMDYMKKDVEDVLTSKGVDFEVNVSYKSHWNSNKITQKGREALKRFGLTPPPKYQTIPDLNILERVTCPNCNSQDTTMKSPFGPTLCRSLHYCNGCRQAFEQFKPV